MSLRARTSTRESRWTAQCCTHPFLAAARHACLLQCWWPVRRQSGSPRALLTPAALCAAGLLRLGQPFAYMPLAQQAAQDAFCEQGTQAGAPGAVLKNISSQTSIPPNKVCLGHRWCSASTSARRRAVGSEHFTTLRASVLRSSADSTGPRAWQAPLVPACAPSHVQGKSKLALVYARSALTQ